MKLIPCQLLTSHSNAEYFLKIILPKNITQIMVKYYLILDIVAALSHFKGIEVYLFGSYAKLIYTEKSDVDIAIVHLKEFRHKEAIIKLISKIEKAYDKKVEVHYFEKESFYRNKKDLLVKGILNDGIRLT